MKNLQKPHHKKQGVILVISFILMMFLLIPPSKADIYQPEGLNMPGAWNGWANPPTNNMALASSTQVVGGRVVKISTGTPRWQTIFSVAESGGDVVGGSYGWLFTSGATSNPWGNKWGSVTVAMNSLQPYTKGGSDNNITVTNGKWYTMNWEDAGYVNTEAIFMETSALPVDILTVTGPSAGTINIPVTVNISTSAALCAEEIIYLRYTTDAWATSIALPVSMSGTAGSVVIPGQPDGTIVSYYLFSSTIPAIAGDYDMQSIKINNNADLNYTYLVGAPPIGWANLQGPATGTINPGQTLDVFAQVNIAGVTGQPSPAPGVQAWIGYNNSNTNPNTWTNWVAASFNGPSGTNDEYKGIIGATLTPGAYYYASRFQLGSGSYVYGGYNTGYWDGTTNVSGILTVNGAAPTITTSSVTAITDVSASGGGTVIADGGSTVTARGICWSTSPDPTTDDFKTIDGDGTGAFTSSMTLLSPGTLYHVRAYATNTTGTGYGSDLQFTTLNSVTFNVDMSTAEGFIPLTDIVYLTGSFTGWSQPGNPGSIAMTEVGTSLIYTATIPIGNGNYEYKHFKNTGWGGGEWGDGNRYLTVAGNTTLNNTWRGELSWANLYLPGTGTIDLDGSFNVYAQAFIPNGVTSAADSAYGLRAWIGYSSDNTNPDTWTNWVPAYFSAQWFDNDEFYADLGKAITVAGTYRYASRFQFGNGAYVYGGFSGSGGGYWDGTNNVSGILNVNAINKTLNLTSVFLEGLYNVTTGSMKQANGDGGLPQYGTGIADQVTVELHNSATYSTVEYTALNVNLSVTGDVIIPVPGTYSGSYYITIKNRNSLETTTKLAVSFNTSTVDYSFGSNLQAYGDNLKNMQGAFPKFVIYTGDVDQDGAVGVLDMTLVDNKSKIFATGYMPEDVDGDGSVGVLDMTLIDNNSKLFVSKNTP